MQTHLDTATTTLCWCWRVARNDGQVLGFTDHDRVISFDGTSYEAETGITASDVHESVGLNVDNVDIQGALTSESLTEADLAAGIYDNAEVQLWLVNWSDTSQRLLIRKGSIGEVTRREHLFISEVRGLAHFLNQEIGRTYQFPCDAQLGDARCTVGISGPTFTGSGAVAAFENRYRFTASGIDTFENGWFAGGLLTWTSGANNGRSVEVKYHALDQGATIAVVELWQETSEDIAATDTFEIIAGCDKTFATCKAKFVNTVNFRGFPHMPGNKIVTSYPTPGDPDNDGNSMQGN
jgi:uncharacterized phage protein (TIGR02218 family)